MPRYSLLRRGSMYILSEEQFKWLLTFGGFNVNRLSAQDNEISILGGPSSFSIQFLVHFESNEFWRIGEFQICFQ